MQDISEYNNNTSEYELFAFFYERIISREIRTFSSLRKLAAAITAGKRNQPDGSTGSDGFQRLFPVILRAFELIKKLNWGFFSSISPQSHEKLWKELVIQDKDFPEAGDLKRTLQISNLYVAMLDIHGYTKFCMDSRKNLSMMHILDRAIEYEINTICTACGAVSQRERGDEVVVVAASATDALTATLSIIDYFSKTKVVQDPNINTRRSSDASALPIFKITAGITGGNTTSPLVMTEKSQLSGFLLNSGARLQMRANELSPKESRVMIAKQVQMNFLKENAQNKCALVKRNAVYFFDTGHIEFKGVIIPTCEVVFQEKERYKEKINENMLQLFGAIRENLWEQRIFIDLVDLLTRTAQVMPKFSVSVPVPVEGLKILTNESLVNLCTKAKLAYVKDEDYALAVVILLRLTNIVERIPSFDRLILDYLKGVSDKYTVLLDSYKENIDLQIETNAASVYQGKYYHTWEAAKKGALMYERLREMGRRSPVITKKKNLWYSLIKQKQSGMVFTLYSGKK